MNIIFKIILFNVLLIYSLKYNTKLLCLLIILFSLYMLYMYYYLNNIIEGNLLFADYKMNFVGLLNKNIKISYKEDLLYDRILDNFTRLLTMMDKSEGRVPRTQMCRGELGKWSDCSRECGRGQMTRRFNMIKEAGEDGIKCIYENGQQETKECFNRLCKFHEECQEDHDCLSNYCSKSEKICTYPHMCERDRLHNCNMEQCQELESKYGDYTYDVDQQRCINKFIDLTVNELTVKDEISSEQLNIIEDQKERKYELIANKINGNFERLCKISTASTPTSPSCSNFIVEDDPTNQNSIIHCNKNREDNIPCYYDNEKKVCQKVSEHPDYKEDDEWIQIIRELDKLTGNNKRFKAAKRDAQEFFECDNCRTGDGVSCDA